VAPPESDYIRCLRFDWLPHGPRASRFTVTYFGSGGAAGAEEEEKKPPPRPGTPHPDHSRSEARASFGESYSGDEDPVQRGDGCAGSGVSDVPPEAERLSGELKALLEADHQVRSGSALSPVCRCLFILDADAYLCCPLHASFL